jgi:formylglycine-generating enzyme required for sulfatase activity
MGSSETDQEHNGDELQREVSITHSYWLGKYEVTQAEWRALMGDAPSAFKGENLPIEQISWARAVEFCRKLTDKERAAGRLPDSLEYSLPTEAQWEYACRAGSLRAYGGTGTLDEFAWFTTNSNSSTHEVGKKQPNAWGLHDMHGNVWEWCADWFSLHKKGAVSDPIGPATGSARVSRGGGWGSSASSCRSAFRFACQPGSQVNNLGLRLALVPVKKPE